MNAAELFVRCLVAEGVTHVFGLPGEENADLMLALHDSDIEFVMTRHEQGAAFMADVWGRLTHTPGVCLSTLGPGATNLTTGVANAHLDRSPVVAITGQAGEGRQHQGSHQYIDTTELFRPITRWTGPVRRPDTVPEVVRKAFALATVGDPGATHVELAEDIASTPVDDTLRPLSVPPAPRAVVPDEVIQDVWDRLSSAERPVALVGNGVLRAGATDALRRLVRSTGLGVANTFMAKGAVPRSWDQALLTTGIGAPDPAAELLQQADLVLAIGYDLVETDPEGLTPRDGEVVHLAATEAETDTHYQPVLQGVGCLRTTLEALADRAAVARIDLSRPEHVDVRARRLAELEVARGGDAPLRPPEVVATLRAELGPSDILLSDVGEHKMQIARLYPCDEPDTCLISNGFASMGFALPGALAARLVHPDPDERKVVAVVGDGGFLMNVQEMETAVRLALPVVVMVWVDGGYGLIEHKQQAEHDRHTDLSFGNPDFVQLARSFGWHAERVDHSRTLRPALQRALGCDRPALVVVPIDYAAV